MIEGLLLKERRTPFTLAILFLACVHNNLGGADSISDRWVLVLLATLHCLERKASLLCRFKRIVHFLFDDALLTVFKNNACLAREVLLGAISVNARKCLPVFPLLYICTEHLEALTAHILRILSWWSGLRHTHHALTAHTLLAQP